MLPWPERHPRTGNLGSVLGFWTGVLVGGAVVALVMIVLGPSRDVRAETGMDDEVETRLLLGLDPEPQPGDPALAPVTPGESPTGEFEALKQLDDSDGD